MISTSEEAKILGQWETPRSYTRMLSYILLQTADRNLSPTVETKTYTLHQYGHHPSQVLHTELSNEITVSSPSLFCFLQKLGRSASRYRAKITSKLILAHTNTRVCSF